jgi:dUTP pyrophosphatase
MQLKVKRLTETAKLPVKAKQGDMGFDIFADEDKTICADDLNASVSTGVAIELPHGYGAFLVGRSGLTSESLFRVNLGVIDQGYRGEIRVMNDVLEKVPYKIYGDNHSLLDFEYEDTFEINKGDKIAQLIILPIPQIEVIEVSELSDTDRGANGFGSTGV